MKFMSLRALLRCGIVVLPLLFTGCSHESPAPDASQSSEIEEDARGAAAAPPETYEPITLSAKRQTAAGLVTAPVEAQLLQQMTTVPGRVQYDAAQHIAVKAPTGGILKDVRVQPGAQVSQGDVLAVMSSPEVGTARSEVMKRQVETEIAREKFGWMDAACNGLHELIAGIKKGIAPQTLAESFGSLKLGNYREQVSSAYSRFLLAESLAVAANKASGTGALSGRTIEERRSERDSAQAALKAVMEQTLFEASQKRDVARLELADAERRLKISRQFVKTLLGDFDSSDLPIDEEELSHVDIRAPISGTIETRTFTNTERLKQGDELFVLANTSRLWIAADIREQEWSALQIAPGQPLKITSPALPDAELTSKVEFVGREVDPRSNAVPLVASISNADGTLRPGQFVWVQLPLSQPRKVLAVPESAIVEHDGKSFVFSTVGQQRFQRVDVTTGIHQGHLVEILSGLKEGEEVVVQGAFILKSELLLEREE